MDGKHHVKKHIQAEMRSAEILTVPSTAGRCSSLAEVVGWMSTRQAQSTSEEMDDRLIVILLLIIGLTLVLNGYVKQHMVCSQPKIPLNRSSSTKPTEVMSTVFSQPRLVT